MFLPGCCRLSLLVTPPRCVLQTLCLIYLCSEKVLLLLLYTLAMPKMEGYLGAYWEVYAQVSEGGIKQKITWSGRVFYKQMLSNTNFIAPGVIAKM